MIFYDWSHWWTRIYHLLMKALLRYLPVGMIGDLQAVFSSVTCRGEFTFHIWVLGPSEVCAVSWGIFHCQVFCPVIGRSGWVWLYTSTLNMCTLSVQLKVGLINRSPMGVHALYRNICHIQQYSTAKHLVWAKCVQKSQQKRCNSFKFPQIQEC